MALFPSSLVFLRINDGCHSLQLNSTTHNVNQRKIIFLHISHSEFLFNAASLNKTEDCAGDNVGRLVSLQSYRLAAKKEFKDIEIHDGGGLNLMVIRDTQSSRNVDFYGWRRVFLLTFSFKDLFSLSSIYHGYRIYNHSGTVTLLSLGLCRRSDIYPRALAFACHRTSNRLPTPAPASAPERAPRH